MRNKQLEGQNLNGEGEWISSTIDISGQDSVDLRVVCGSDDVSSQAKVEAYYQTNNNGLTLFEQRTGDFGTDTLIAKGVSGDSLQLRVRMDQIPGGGTSSSHFIEEVLTIRSSFCWALLIDTDLSSQISGLFKCPKICLGGTGSSYDDCSDFEPLEVCVNEPLGVQIDHMEPGIAEADYTVWTDGPVTNVSSVGGSVTTLNCPSFPPNNEAWCTQDGPGQAGLTFSFTSPGTYTIYAQGDNGTWGSCPSSWDCQNPPPPPGHHLPGYDGRFEIEVEVIGPLQSSDFTISPQQACKGNSFDLSYNGPGDLTSFNADLSGLPCSQQQTNTNTISLSCSQAGTYTIPFSAENKCGSKITDDVTITVLPDPTADAGNNITFCEGDINPPFYLGGNPSASGGTPPYDHDWSGGPLLSPSSDPNPQFDHNAGPGTYNYILTVQDANGCTDKDEVTVTVNESPFLNVGQPLLPPPPYCQEDLDGTPLTFLVSKDPNANLNVSPNGVVNCFSQFPNFCFVSVDPSQSTTFTFTATGDNGCETSETVTINIQDCDCDDHNAPNNRQLGTALPGADDVNSGAPQIPNVDYTIGGTFTVNDDLTFSGNDVVMNTDAEIVVEAGNTLTITDGARLFACDEMWDRILVEGDGELIVDQGSFVEDGKKAVVLENGPNGQTASDLLLNGAHFDKNRQHVVVEAFENGIHPATINGTKFTCEGVNSPGDELKAPHAGEITERGVHIKNVGPLGQVTNGFVVGDQDTNHFDRMKFGVFADASEFLVSNCKFTNITKRSNNSPTCSGPPCEGTAIYGEGMHPNHLAAFIGRTDPNEPGLPNEGNRFEDVYHDVELYNYREVEVIDNVMRNPSGTNTNNGLSGVRGVLVSHPDASDLWHITVDLNLITDHRTGVRVEELTAFTGQKTLQMEGNLIRVPNAGHAGRGIQVVAAGAFTPFGPWSIAQNTITQTNSGIRLTNIQRNDDHSSVALVNNTLELFAPFVPPPATLFANGIKLENCRGINTHGNFIDLVRDGVIYDGTAPGGGFIANEFTSYTDGLTLINGAEMADQGGPVSPSMNRFHGTAGNADIFVDGSSNSGGTDFYVDSNLNPDVPNQFDGNGPQIALNNINAFIIPQCFLTPIREPDAPTVEEAERVAGDSLNYVYEPQSSEWRFEQQTYRALKVDTTLTDSSTTLKAFEDSLDNATMGRVREIDEAVDQGNIGMAQALHNGMSCTHSCETRYKEFFDVFLSSTAQGSSCNASQIQKLWDIAEECPLKDGEAVFRARVLLRSELDSNIVFDADCSPDSLGKNKPSSKTAKKAQDEEAVESLSEASFEWRPNPAKERSVLRYDLGGRSEASLKVTDLQGREIETRRIGSERGSLNLDVASWGTGVYLYRVEKNGERLGTGRLIITD